MQSGQNLGPRGTRRDADDRPSEISQLLETGDIPGELDAVGAVMIAVVFKGNQQGLPPHIEVILAPAIDDDGDLRSRPGETRLNDLMTRISRDQDRKAFEGWTFKGGPADA